MAPAQLFSSHYQDCYFRLDAPLEEIEYVFIRSTQLLQSWSLAAGRDQSTFVIAETGFGSGLNFFVTWHHWLKWCEANPKSSMVLQFVSVELHPLSAGQLRQVHEGFPQFSGYLERVLERLPPPWQGSHQIHLGERLQLQLLYGDGLEMLQTHQFIADTWYLDGFAPRTNARMWSDALFEELATHSRPKARLATFTSAGFVGRGLSHVGFHVHRIAGFRKRQMICAHFQACAVSGFYSSRARRPAKIPQDIAIIGAGYAGLHLAQALLARGKNVQVFDAGSSMGAASNNHAHLLYLHPRIAVNAFNSFYEQAYSFSINAYRDVIGAQPIGVWHRLTKQLASIKAADVAQFWPPEWLRYARQEESLGLVGRVLPGPGLWMPKGYVIQPQLFGASVLEQFPDKARFYSYHRLMDLKYTDRWQLTFESANQKSNKVFDAVVLATGAGSIPMLQALGNTCLGSDPSKPSHWRYPLRPIAGQSTVIASGSNAVRGVLPLKSAICGECYVTPAIDGRYSVGSTFSPDQWAGSVDHAGHEKNMQGLEKTLGEPTSHLIEQVVTGFSATRLQTTDYLPMVGSVLKELGPHLYLMAGFGAKGACVTPFAAHLLASDIAQEPSFFDSALELLDPDRFARRIR